MKRLAIIFLFLTQGYCLANSEDIRPTKGEHIHETSGPQRAPSISREAVKEALRKISADRQIQLRPILVQKHAAIRAVMDDKSSPPLEKKTRIERICAEYDEQLSAVYVRASRQIDLMLTPPAKESK